MLLNLEIIERGYGHAYTRFPFSKMEEFRAAERYAREARRGLWAEEAGETAARSEEPWQPPFSSRNLGQTTASLASARRRGAVFQGRSAVESVAVARHAGTRASVRATPVGRGGGVLVTPLSFARESPGGAAPPNPLIEAKTSPSEAVPTDTRLDPSHQRLEVPVTAPCASAPPPTPRGRRRGGVRWRARGWAGRASYPGSHRVRLHLSHLVLVPR